MKQNELRPSPLTIKKKKENPKDYRPKCEDWNYKFLEQT